MKQQGWRHRAVRWVVGPVMVALAAFSSVTNATAAADVAPAGGERAVLVMGDSLSAAYGLAPTQGWVSLLATQWAAQGPKGWRIVNASVSGETTAGGAARIAGELARVKPAVVVIELGANDGLRGLPLDAARANLAKMITASQAAGAKVLLLGMRIPPNYGREYAEGFHAMFVELAKAHDAALLPFFLEPIVSSRDNFQEDNVHPTAAVQPQLRDHAWSALAPLLKD